MRVARYAVAGGDAAFSAALRSQLLRAITIGHDADDYIVKCSR
jgi:hypothetical protein